MRKDLMRIISCVLFLMVIAGGALADPLFHTSGNPGDTPAGTVIRSSTEVNTFDYEDVLSHPRDTVYGATIEITAAAEKGFSTASIGIYPVPLRIESIGGLSAEVYFYLTPGSTEIAASVVTNEGNAPITLTVAVSPISYGGTPGADHWQLGIWEGATDYGLSRTKTISDDADYSSEIRLTPATTEADSPDLSACVFTATVTTEVSNHTGNEFSLSPPKMLCYTGANDLTYGGLAYAGPNITLSTVEAPVLVISRTMTVDSPSSYEGWGSVHDFVPGALWTFTITYTNEGSGPASNVMIFDKVPANCVPHKIDVQNPENHVNVTAPYMTGEATWYIMVSEDDPPDFTTPHSLTLWATEAGWYLGATNPYAVSPPYNPNTYECPFNDPTRQNSMKWIKFQAPVVQPGETGTISWSVYLK